MAGSPDSFMRSPLPPKMDNQWLLALAPCRNTLARTVRVTTANISSLCAMPEDSTISNPNRMEARPRGDREFKRGFRVLTLAFPSDRVVRGPGGGAFKRVVAPVRPWVVCVRV